MHEVWQLGAGAHALLHFIMGLKASNREAVTSLWWNRAAAAGSANIGQSYKTLIYGGSMNVKNIIRFKQDYKLCG